MERNKRRLREALAELAKVRQETIKLPADSFEYRHLLDTRSIPFFPRHREQSR
jgi:hypothetical protein